MLVNFKSQLAVTPSPASDRAKWQNEADLVGHEPLFDALWQQLDLIHLAKNVVRNDPIGSLLPAERASVWVSPQITLLWIR